MEIRQSHPPPQPPPLCTKRYQEIWYLSEDSDKWVYPAGNGGRDFPCRGEHLWHDPCRHWQHLLNGREWREMRAGTVGRVGLRWWPFGPLQERVCSSGRGMSLPDFTVASPWYLAHWGQSEIAAKYIPGESLVLPMCGTTCEGGEQTWRGSWVSVVLWWLPGSLEDRGKMDTRGSSGPSAHVEKDRDEYEVLVVGMEGLQCLWDGRRARGWTEGWPWFLWLSLQSQTWWPKPTSVYCLARWRTEVWSQGMGRASLPSKVLGRILQDPLLLDGNPWISLACRQTSSTSTSFLHDLHFSVCVRNMLTCPNSKNGLRDMWSSVDSM
jgi:hypothetical protein